MLFKLITLIRIEKVFIMKSLIKNKKIRLNDGNNGNF